MRGTCINAVSHSQYTFTQSFIVSCSDNGSDRPWHNVFMHQFTYLNSTHSNGNEIEWVNYNYGIGSNEQFEYANDQTNAQNNTLTSSSVIKMLGSGDCVMPKFDANCLATACDTSRPATFENLFNTVFADPLLFSAMTDNSEAHSEYIWYSFDMPFTLYTQTLLFSHSCPLIFYTIFTCNLKNIAVWFEIVSLTASWKHNFLSEIEKFAWANFFGEQIPRKIHCCYVSYTEVLWHTRTVCVFCQRVYWQFSVALPSNTLALSLAMRSRCDVCIHVCSSVPLCFRASVTLFNRWKHERQRFLFVTQNMWWEKERTRVIRRGW